MNSLNILVEAKKEYTNQLQKILTPRIYEGFKSIYEEIIKVLTDEIQEKKTQSSSVIKTFQKTLKEIPQWNQEMINNEYNRIEKTSNCDYFDNLIEAIFITNTKILTSVQINDKTQNIKINIPQSSHFIHKCYMECAKEIYKNPYIFDQSKNLLSKEKHNNLRDALNLIDNSINNAIRNLLPIRDILMQGITKNNISLLANLDSNEEKNNKESKKNTTMIEEEDDTLSENVDSISEEDITETKEDITETKEDITETKEKEDITETKEEENIDESKEILEIKDEEISEKKEEYIPETKEIFLNNISQTVKKINSIEKIEEILEPSNIENEHKDEDKNEHINEDINEHIDEDKNEHINEDKNEHINEHIDEHKNKHIDEHKNEDKN